MADSTTSGDLGLTKPEVGASRSTWGTKLNTNFDDIDTAVTAISDVADGALPKAGGTMTGDITLTGHKLIGAKIIHPYPIEITASTPTPGGGSVTVNYATSNVANVGTVSGTTLSVTISNRPAGSVSGDFHLAYLLGNFTATNGCVITFADSFVYRLGLGEVVDSIYGPDTFHYWSVKGKVCIPIMIQST